MAKQRGILKISGSIGDISFYEDKRHGFIARKKGGPSKRQIKTSKSCKEVRQNNSEFGAASSAGALLRQAFHPLIHHCREYSMSRRLQKELLSIIKADTVHEPGKRKLRGENLSTFTQFELTVLSASDKWFDLPVKREKTAEGLSVEAFLVFMSPYPSAATHFEVCSVTALVDFDKKTKNHDLQCSGKLVLNSHTSIVGFEHPVDEKGMLFHGMGILFYQWIGGAYVLLQEERLRAGFFGFVGVEG